MLVLNMKKRDITSYSLSVVLKYSNLLSLFFSTVLMKHSLSLSQAAPSIAFSYTWVLIHMLAGSEPHVPPFWGNKKKKKAVFFCLNEHKSLCVGRRVAGRVIMARSMRHRPVKRSPKSKTITPTGSSFILTLARHSCQSYPIFFLFFYPKCSY